MSLQRCRSPASPDNISCHAVFAAARCTNQLGEGGYAFVYLAKELPTSERPSAASDAVAIKKVRLQLAPLPNCTL
jgi:hypothetical protein